MGFNYSAYREANKVQLFLVKKSTQETRKSDGKYQVDYNKEPVDTFTAYTTQDFDLNISLNIAEGMFDQAIAEVNDKLPLFAKAAGMISNNIENDSWKQAMKNIQGLGMLSYSKHGNYKGTDTLKFPLKCYLTVVNGTYQSDVLDNLRKAITWFVPSRGILDVNKELGSISGSVSALGDSASDSLKKKFGDDSLLAEISKALAKAASAAINMASEELGDAYSLQLPEAYDGNHIVNFKWGDLELSDVLIKNFSIKVPTIMTVDNRPDTFEISFSVETAHVVDTTMLENLYKINSYNGL